MKKRGKSTWQDKAVTQAANHGSCRLLEKVGLHHLHNVWCWNATQRVYEIIRSEWLAIEKR